MKYVMLSIVVIFLSSSAVQAERPQPRIAEPTVLYDRTQHGYAFYRWGTALGGLGYSSCIVDFFLLDENGRQVAKDTAVVTIRPGSDGVERVLEVVAVPVEKAARITGYDINMTCY